MNIPKNKHLGKLCKRGHDWNNTGKSLRYNTNWCVECAHEYCIKQRKYRDGEYRVSEKTKDKMRRAQTGRKHSEETKNKIAKSKIGKFGILNNNYKGGRNATYLRNKKDPKFILNKRMSNAIGKSIMRNKKGYHWENLVDYTLDELKQHLIKTIPNDYKWQDFLDGKLHIDHIIPKVVFNFSRPEHIDFIKCWALKNLRLLPAKENLSKGSKLNHAFQPSLKLEA